MQTDCLCMSLTILVECGTMWVSRVWWPFWQGKEGYSLWTGTRLKGSLYSITLCVEILVWGIFPMISQTSISSRWYSVILYKLHFNLYIYICMHVALLSCSLYELQFVILAAHLSLIILGTREGQSARNSYKVEDVAFLDLKGLCL